MSIEFNGSESPADIVKIVIDEFLRSPHPATCSIFYENTIPRMRYQLEVGDVEFSCIYRLDTMLEPFYGEAEHVFDELAQLGVLAEGSRELLVPAIAFCGMSTMLLRLLILQAQVFGDNFEEAQVTARSMFLHALLVTHAKPENREGGTKAASATVKEWIDNVVNASMKKKRDFLVGYMNTQRMLKIPTGAIGRPKGSKKPEAKKRQEAEEFEKRIEQTVCGLFEQTGKVPKKTDVADALGTGGVNLSKGSDTRLNSFNNKLDRLGIDYRALITRLNLH